MEVDISNKTIVVLVVLTVIISVLSTMVVLNEISNIKLEKTQLQSSTHGASSGKVSLEILPSPTQTTGRVTFVVLPDKEE